MTDQIFTGIGNGYPLLPGASKVSGGWNFCVEAREGSEVSLVLYKKGTDTPFQTVKFEEQNRVGNMYTMFLEGFKAENYEYNFRIDGKILQDPYARSIQGREVFGVLPVSEHSVRCGFLTLRKYEWEQDAAPGIPYQDKILYKVHVRGYTKQAKLSPKKRGTFSGLKDMIPYWKELGINAVELMPAYEFAEVAKEKDKKDLISIRTETNRVNFWGYTDGWYFAPKRSYCMTKSPENEFRDFIKALHAAGMECIMEFCFSSEVRPLLALRALQFWKMFYHVDGFHLVGDGVPMNLILQDGVLSGTKILASGVDRGMLDKSSAGEKRLFAEYHSGFLQDMRRFLKSDEDCLESAAYQIRHNGSNYGVINYMTSQDGFTLNDMVSYNYKHNEDNGENNQDGSSYNYSWNCGVEGPTKKAAVRQVRQRQMKNAFLMMLLSQGVPMIYGGDETGNSQDGNNNAYCQDNPVGWTDWKGLKSNRKLLEFVKEAIAFRREHPILHMEHKIKGTDYKALGYPDVSLHSERAWYCSYDNTSRLVGIMYYGPYEKKADQSPDDILYVAYNFHWEERSLALPNLPKNMKWIKIADTSETKEGPSFYKHEESYKRAVQVPPRTIIVLQGE